MATQTKDRPVSQDGREARGDSKYDRFVEQFEERIREKTGSNAVCPMCTHNTWIVADGELSIPLRGWEKSPSGQVRAVLVICDHCGFMANFWTRKYDI